MKITKSQLKSIVKNLMEEGTEFDYMLLSRLQQDNEYYLNAGSRSPKVLWANDEVDQIEKMKELYNKLDKKPDWISMDDIEEYERQMVTNLDEDYTEESNYSSNNIPQVNELNKNRNLVADLGDGFVVTIIKIADDKFFVTVYEDDKVVHTETHNSANSAYAEYEKIRGEIASW